MEQTEQSASSTEQVATTEEFAGAGANQAIEGCTEKPKSGLVRGLIEGLKIVVGMLVFIGLAIYSASHHPHPPVHR